MEAFTPSTYLFMIRLLGFSRAETRKDGNKKQPKNLSVLRQKLAVALGKNFLLTFVVLGE